MCIRDSLDGLGAALVHREALTVPVAAAAQLFQMCIRDSHHGDEAAGGVGGHLYHAVGAALVLLGKGHIGGKGKLGQIDLCGPERGSVGGLDNHAGLFGRVDVYKRQILKFSVTYLSMNPGEFPHSEISGSMLICSSPKMCIRDSFWIHRFYA